MKAITDWINSHKVLTVCIAFFLLIVQPFLVHVVLLIPVPFSFMVTRLEDIDLLNYVAGFEAFLGTVFLGIVAVRQNEKANEISVRLLKLEETQLKFDRIPSLFLSDVSCTCIKESDMIDKQKNLFLQERCYPDENGNVFVLNIKLINVTKSCVEISVDSFERECKDNGKKIKLLEFVLNAKSNTMIIPPAGEYEINIGISPKDLYYTLQTKNLLVLTLKTQIGEVYSTTISFSTISSYNGYSFYESTYSYILKSE